MKASNLVVRLTTAALGLPIILAFLYWVPPLAFFGLVVFAVALTSYEFFQMTHPLDRPSRLWGVALSVGVSVSLYFFGSDSRIPLSMLVGIPLLGPMLTLGRLGEMETAATRAISLGFGPFFVGGPLTLLALLRRDLPAEGGDFVVFTLGLAWLSDTGGYFFGRAFGGPKLYEAVSPKKTVAGSVGAFVTVFVWALVTRVTYLRSLPLTHALGLALVGGGLGQLGDLGESLLKRSTGVKDSGQVLPGHGGLLDRVDALLVTSVVVYLYVLWIH